MLRTATVIQIFTDFLSTSFVHTKDNKFVLHRMRTVVPFCLLMLMASVEFGRTDRSVCPQGTYYCREVFNERCYPSFLDHQWVTWHEAQKECVRLGKPSPWVWYVQEYIGNLASFHNKEQFDFLMRFVGREGGLVWIGLNNINKNKWKFSDGSPLNFVPAKTALRAEEEGAALDTATGRLVSRKPSDRLRFVCLQCEYDKQWPKNSIPYVLDEQNRRVCEHGVCYGWRYSLFTRTFDESKEYCEDIFGGHLAAFHSREMFEFLIDVATFNGDNPGTWVGANNRNGERWTFTDGSPMDYAPDVMKFNDSPNPGCAAIMGLREPVLQDINCAENRRFICLLPD